MKSVPLKSLFGIFFRMGAIGFGGPVALVSLMEAECSHKRGWLTLEEFNERYVFCKLMPGPVASQMAMWMGYHVRGRRGGVVAGLAFLLPAFTLILILSIFYSKLTGLPRFTPLVQGMEAGALVIITESVVRMFLPYARRIQPWIFLVFSAVLMLSFPRWEPLIILFAGLIMVAVRAPSLGTRPLSFALFPFSTLLELFLVHFKAGLTVFGTGLAVIPVLQHEVVQTYRWMSNSEFLDGIAFGQITPGPVTITSVFVGYRSGGILGAFSACLGMYLPGALLILLVMPLIFERLKGRPFVANFQSGAIPAVIGCILGATFVLGSETITNWPLLCVLVILAVITWRLRPPAWLTVLLGSLLNLVWSLL